MANTQNISISNTLKVDGLNASDVFSASKQITQNAPGIYSSVATIGTTDAAIVFDGITTPGYISITNLDATNFVEFGPTVAGAMAPLVRLKAGESATFRITPAGLLRSKADTAACLCAVKCWND